MLVHKQRWAAFFLVLLVGGTMLALSPGAAASDTRFEHITIGYGPFALFEFHQEGTCAGRSQAVTVFVDVTGPPLGEALKVSALCGGVKATGCTASSAAGLGYARCSNSGWQQAKGTPLCIRSQTDVVPIDVIWTVRCVFNSGIPI